MSYAICIKPPARKTRLWGGIVLLTKHRKLGTYHSLHVCKKPGRFLKIVVWFSLQTMFVDYVARKVDRQITDMVTLRDAHKIFSW